MKRITISLPEDVIAALEREARRERASVSEIARKAIKERLGRPSAGEKRLPFVGIASSDGKGPYARDLDDFLRKEWTIDRDRG